VRSPVTPHSRDTAASPATAANPVWRRGPRSRRTASRSPTSSCGSGARLIDGLIVGGIATVIFVPVIIGIVVATTDASSAGPSVLLLLLAELGLFLFILVGQYVYEVELAKRTGQTVGKRLLKIRVVPLAPQQPIARVHLAKRWLVTGPGGMIPGLGLINAVWCLWDKAVPAVPARQVRRHRSR
jgi:uncharacterized RDD family membrane protein YckC